ncbi:type II toxin-antitoxin system VapC family toxin [Halomicrobium zhouii]|uniref:type II toxin-antitoxin system VapC family toxin n=1 Tax=Halomicrobium zhouii TaxID=767519 RepID=UPI001FE6C805|nr:PIN domain-containing protein [Halomicrobium zhouii]
MSIFVDTGVFYAHHDEDSPRHDPATAAMRAAISGEFGRLLTSDYVYDETVTLALSRFEDPEEARGVGDRIRGCGPFPDAVDMVFVGREGSSTASRRSIGSTTRD